MDIVCAIHGCKIDETEFPARNDSTIITYPCQQCIDAAVDAAAQKIAEGIDG